MHMYMYLSCRVCTTRAEETNYFDVGWNCCQWRREKANDFSLQRKSDLEENVYANASSCSFAEKTEDRRSVVRGQRCGTSRNARKGNEWKKNYNRSNAAACVNRNKLNNVELNINLCTWPTLTPELVCFQFRYLAVFTGLTRAQK